MDLGLKGKVVIVTGASQGIGRVIARTFAEEGAKVVVSDIQEVGSKVAEECQAKGTEAIFVKTDVSKLEETDKMVKATLDKFGRLDILVHNAAAFSIGPFMDTPLENWDKVIKVCQYGAMNCYKSALGPMMQQKSGSIVSIGSDGGRVGEANQAVYSGAKGGVIALTKAVAQEVGRFGIRANIVCPGITITEENREFLETSYFKDEEKKKRALAMYPLRKFGKGEDIANTVVFLASERASHTTGQTISVNGGYSML